MSQEMELLALVGRIYDAALDPGIWPDVLKQAAALVDAPSSVLAFQDFDGQELSFVDSVGRDPSYWKSYNEHFFFVSPYVRMMKDSGERCYATQDLLSDAELVRTEYYNDWLQPQDIHYHAGAVVLRTARAAGLVEFQVGKGHGPFPPGALRIIGLLAPHYKRAIAIGRTLGTLRGVRTAVLDTLARMDVGVILLDERGRPAYLNPAAEGLAGALLGLQVSAQGLRAQDAAEDAQLQRLIASSLSTAWGQGEVAGGSLLLRRAGREPPVIVAVSPLGEGRLQGALPQGRIRAVVFLSRRAAPPGLEGMFRTLFGLTAAEARVAMALVDGDNAGQIAERLRVGRETVRTQTKAVYGKTGVKRQGQFIKLALSSPAPAEPLDPQ